MNNKQLLFLSSQDVRSLLSLDECIAAIEHAFRLHGERKVHPPAVLGMHVDGGGFHIKAGLLDLGRPYFAAKVNGNFPSNKAKSGLPTIQGLLILCDATNGAPLAIMDSGELTALRTAAATAVAAKYLARKKSKVATICGCGIQGRVQLQALSRVRKLEGVFAFDKDQAQAVQFANELTGSLNTPVIVASDLCSAIQQSDICVTCTTSQEPIVFAKGIRDGTFIAAVGADNPTKQEIDARLLEKSKVVCDVLDQCADMGDLHHALQEGLLTRADVHAELGEVVAGVKVGRESEAEIIVFDSTGMALQDVAAAACLYEKAEQKRAGLELSLAV